MGSIINRDGRWRAQVRRKGFPKKCKTFDTKAQAQAWVNRLEADIADGNVSASIGDTTIGDVIRAYRSMRDRARPISDSSNEHYMLKALEAGLGSKMLRSVTPDDLVSYSTQRREDGAGPYTINMDISKLGTVIRYGCASLRITPPDIVGAARPLLAHLRLIGGGGKRERRPTEDELISIFDHLRKTYGMIYEDAARFAALTAMRRGEICEILKADLDPEKRIVPVMRKHPRKGKVLEVVPLIGEAWDIAVRQKGEDPRIFPIHPQTLSKYFKETCKALGIVDLHFHDLRHEGTSRLFEDGYSIEQVALVTGHKSWNMLKRYTQLKPEHLTRQAAQSRQDERRRPGNQPNASRRQGTSSQGKSRR